MDIQSQVYRFYHAADVVVVPSLNEVLPLVICEAMSFCKPVIASAIAAIPEAMNDGKEGFLIQPEDPDTLCKRIFQLYNDPDLRAKLGANGRQRVLQQLAYDQMGCQYRLLLDKICNNNANVSIGRNGSCISIQSNVSAVTNVASGFHGEVILVDIDNTIVDWDAEFLKRFSKNEKAPINLAKIMADRSMFEIENCFPPQLYVDVIDTITQPGFYLNLKPFEGAIEALKGMLASGLDVRLVTSTHPLIPSVCAAEKYQWVDKYLGSDWIGRLVITMDKTYITGMILVDDKPVVTGGMSPVWQHVVFDQSYNRHVVGMPRIGAWTNWLQIFTELI